MRDLLQRLLTPADDGRGFADAVLLRASGALHRRRAAAAETMPAVGWLEAWARPWVVGALLLFAFAALAPLRPAVTRHTVAVEADARGGALLNATQPEDLLALTVGN